MPPQLKQLIKEVLEYIGGKLDAIANKQSIQVDLKGVQVVTLQGEPGKPGHTPTDEELLRIIVPLLQRVAKPSPEELLALIRPLIPVVKDGETPSDERLINLIEPLIPKPIPGRPGKNGSPDTGEQIIGKINADKSGRKIQREHVEGLAEIEDEIKTTQANLYGLRAAGDTVYTADLSSQTDGSTKTFTLNFTYRRINKVLMSDAPHLLLLGNGYTYSGSTLTLTITDAPSAGSQLAVDYVV